MEKYVPDIYQKDIYSINYDSLILRGIRLLLFDLDNTLVPVNEKVARDETKKLFKELKEKDFKIMIVSNSLKNRVKPIADELKVEYLCNTRKPKIDRLKEFLDGYKFTLDQIAIIGDSMMDDVVCGNTLVITTILTDQIHKKEFPFARLKRIYERRIQKKLRDHNLFTKGRYYE